MHENNERKKVHAIRTGHMRVANFVWKQKSVHENQKNVHESRMQDNNKTLNV